MPVTTEKLREWVRLMERITRRTRRVLDLEGTGETMLAVNVVDVEIIASDMRAALLDAEREEARR